MIRSLSRCKRRIRAKLGINPHRESLRKDFMNVDWILYSTSTMIVDSIISSPMKRANNMLNDGAKTEKN